MRLIGTLLVNVLTLFVVSYILPGFQIDGLTAALVVAVLIGVVNTFIKPLLQILTLPLTLLTLGLWAFVINVLLLLGVAYVVPGFSVDGFLTAAIASILLALVSSFLQNLTK